MNLDPELVILKCHSGSEFRHGTLRRGIIFPQLGGFRITGTRQKQVMPALACGWPVVQRELLFQSFN